MKSNGHHIVGVRDPGRLPPIFKTSMVGPLGGGAGSTGNAHHLVQRHLWWALWEVVLEGWEPPPLNSKMSMVGPLGGGAGRTESAHHSVQRRRWWSWRFSREFPVGVGDSLSFYPVGGGVSL
jgi:hypothetical protein